MTEGMARPHTLPAGFVSDPDIAAFRERSLAFP